MAQAAQAMVAGACALSLYRLPTRTHGVSHAPASRSRGVRLAADTKHSPPVARRGSMRGALPTELYPQEVAARLHRHLRRGPASTQVHATAVAKRFLVFEEARELVWEKRLTSQADWTRWCKEGNRPPNVPSRPQQTYANEGWMSWPDWLGHGVGQQPRGTFLPFAEARELVWLEDLATKEKWRDWCTEGDRPATVPSNPDKRYADEGWLSWPDWLGTNPGALPRYGRGKDFLGFEVARELVRGMGLLGTEQWWEWCRWLDWWASGARPPTIPWFPNLVYKNEGWVSWPDWLGYGEGKPPAGTFLVFEDARGHVRDQRFSSRVEWEAWHHRPVDVPSHPDRTYAREGWVCWDDWLGL